MHHFIGIMDILQSMARSQIAMRLDNSSRVGCRGKLTAIDRINNRKCNEQCF